VDIEDRDYGGRGFSCRDLEDHLWNFATYDPWKHIDFEEFCVSLTCKITLRDTPTPSVYGAIA